MSRILAFSAACILATAFVGCSQQDEQSRATSEAGGTIPWNRPAGWEGPGVLGSQMSQMQGTGTGPFQ